LSVVGLDIKGQEQDGSDFWGKGVWMCFLFSFQKTFQKNLKIEYFKNLNLNKS
jgi:hypothetical protein